MTSTNQDRRAFSVAQLIVVLGASVVALSTMLPWVHVFLLGDLTLFDLYDHSGDGLSTPVLIVLASVIVGALALVRVRGWALIALVVALVGGGIGWSRTNDSVQVVRLLNPLLSMGAGPVVAGVGVVVVIVGGVMDLVRRSR